MIICQSRQIVPTTPDPNFSDVKLLMGFEGPNGSITTGMADESGSAHGTASGVHSSFACISTAARKFGGSSLALTGNNLYYADSSDWALGSGNFTVEMFFNPTAMGTAFLLCQFGAAAPNFGWVLWINTDKLAWNVSTTGTNNLSDLVGTTTLTTARWYHACVDYDGTRYRLYLDGVMEAFSTTARTIFHPTQNLGIGANSVSNDWQFPGYLDEIRLTKGVARYASDGGFTVPASAYPRS